MDFQVVLLSPDCWCLLPPVRIHTVPLFPLRSSACSARCCTLCDRHISPSPAGRRSPFLTPHHTIPPRPWLTEAAGAQLTLPQGQVAVTPLQVANQTVDASTAAQAQPYNFTTVLTPGVSSNWSSQVGVDACLPSTVAGAVPALYGNGTSVLGYAQYVACASAHAQVQLSWGPQGLCMPYLCSQCKLGLFHG